MQYLCSSPKLVSPFHSPSTISISIHLLNRELSGSRCFCAPRYLEFVSVSVKTVACWSEYNFFMRRTYGSLMDCLVRDLQSFVVLRVKGFCKVHRGDPDVHPPFSACWIKQSVYHQIFFWSNGGVKLSVLLVSNKTLYAAATVGKPKLVGAATQRKGAAPQWAALQIPRATTQCRRTNNRGHRLGNTC